MSGSSTLLYARLLGPSWLQLTNDLLWWIPFGPYLRDAWPAFRRDA